MSDAQSELAAALVDALAEMEDLPRTKTAKVETKTGGSYSYNYADLGDALSYVRPILAKHGLAVMQDAHGDGHGVAVTTTILHRTGQTLTSSDLSMSAGSTPQAAGSAITYARRYQLLAVLGLATEDDDGAAATKDARKQQPPPRPSDAQLDELHGIRDGLKELATDPANVVTVENARKIWRDVTGRVGRDPVSMAEATDLLNRLGEAGIYVPDGEPFELATEEAE